MCEKNKNDKFDLLIKNGTIVTAAETYQADIGITGDIITGIGKLEAKAQKTIDATGKYIIPGVIDGHMHVEAPMGGVISADDFYTQSISAAFGGVTTFMDFTNAVKGDSLVEKFLERQEEMSKSAIDYSIHGRIVEDKPNLAGELAQLVDLGCPSFKMYMTYKEDGFMIAEDQMLQVFHKAKEAGALSLVHCESDVLCDYFSQKVSGEEKSWELHAKSKPIICEADAAARAINFSKAVGNSLLIVHSTNGAVLEMAKKAQSEGYPIYLETCPHYLTVFDDIYKGEEGHLAICSPPLRTPREAEHLWDGMAKGVISITGSDDCSFTKEAKEKKLERDSQGKFIQDYKKVVSGSSGIEARLTLLLSEGVNKGRITMNQLVALTSTNLAKLFGMYPQKGCIECGSQGDLVIIDTEAEHVLSHENLHNHVGYTIFEGMQVKGRPISTILRGKVIVDKDRFVGEKFAGHFVKRKIEKEILEAFRLR